MKIIKNPPKLFPINFSGSTGDGVYYVPPGRKATLTGRSNQITQQVNIGFAKAGTQFAGVGISANQSGWTTGSSEGNGIQMEMQQGDMLYMNGSTGGSGQFWVLEEDIDYYGN